MNQRRLRKSIVEGLLRPFITAVKDQDWDALQRYFKDDVLLSVSDNITESLPQRHSQGKAQAILRLQKSPFRGGSGMTFNFSFPEVRSDHGTVIYEVVGKNIREGREMYLRGVYQLEIVQDQGRWLISKMLWDDFEAVPIPNKND